MSVNIVGKDINGFDGFKDRGVGVLSFGLRFSLPFIVGVNGRINVFVDVFLVEFVCENKVDFGSSSESTC